MLLLGWLLPYDLVSLFVELHVRMRLMEGSLDDGHERPTQSVIIVCFSVIQLLIWIMDIKLGVGRSVVRRREEGGSLMMEFSTDPKGVWSCAVEDGMIY